MKHLIALILFLNLSLTLSSSSVLASSPGQLSLPTLSPQQAAGLIKAGRIFVVDAMDKVGFSKFHVLGALNIPDSEVPGPGDNLTYGPRLRLPKTAPIIVCCN